MLDIVQNSIARSIDDVLCILNSEPETKIIAGGTDVLIKIREGKIPHAKLVSIGAIPELKGTAIRDDGIIRIGPLSTFRELESDQLVAQNIPIIAKAAMSVGGPQIRAVGTIGGNICNGATSADTAPSLFTLNAKLVLMSKERKRTVSIQDFYLGPGKVDLPYNEIMTDILISRDDYSGYCGYYYKYAMRNAMDISTIGCAVQVKLNENGRTVNDIRIAYGVAAPTPIRLTKAEEALRGKDYADVLELGPDLVRAEIKPRDSWRASKAFREHIAGEIFKTSVYRALEGIASSC